MKQAKRNSILTYIPKQNQLILTLILLVGSVLRLYDFFNMPFSYDEFSALFRTRFDTFSELIEKGVLPDFHPAGVQLFLFYWTKLVGEATWLVKLPFVIASILSIWLTYKIGKKWHNETVGLLGAAFIATTQYCIVLGTYARPYASGLFLTLILVNALTNMIQRSKHNYWFNWSVFVISGIACSYNHYFSMFFAGIVGISGFFFINRAYWLKYISAGLIIGAAYLPHIPILQYQLDKGDGGIGGPNGWLGAPDKYFFTDYFMYIFHFSWISVGLFTTLFIYGVSTRIKTKSNALIPDWSNLKYILLSFLWFCIPILVGYYYSVHYNPILQFSILTFSHVFLFYAFFGSFTQLNPKKNAIIVVLIITTNIFTLIQRKHFDLHYNSIYLEFVRDAKEVNETYKGNISVCLENNWDAVNYYETQLGLKAKFDKFSDFKDNQSFLAYLDSISKKSDFFYFGDFFYNQPRLVAEIQQFYPHIVFQRNYVSGTGYLFSKKGSYSKLATISDWIPGTIKLNTWQTVDQSKFITLDEKTIYEMDSTMEFGPSIEVDLAKITNHHSNLIDVIMEIEPVTESQEILLTSSMYIADTLNDWQGSSSKEQLLNGTCNKLIHTFQLGNEHLLQTAKVRFQVWNISKSNVRIKSIILILRDGNRVKYGLIQKIS